MSIIRRFATQKNFIKGNSMVPTFIEGEVVLLRKVLFRFSPKRFDIVKFNFNDINYVKRVIGLPNETIALKKTNISINSQVISETFVRLDFLFSDLFCKLDDDEIFVLGDNRSNSADSRTLGPIMLSQVTGFIRHV